MSWPTVSLGEVAEHCLGKMLDAQKNKGTPYPYLRNPNVRWMEVDLSEIKQMPFEDHELDRYGLKAGDVVICEGGEAGRAAIWDGSIPHMKIQKAIHRVRVGPSLDNRYLVHRIRHDYFRGALSDYYTGATIKHLTGQDLARYRFPLPPLDEQRRIAAILDAADSLRAKRRAALAKLDQLAQSIFIEMFGDPAINPKGWDRKRLIELCQDADDIKCGPFGTQLSKSEYQLAGVPLWGIKQVNSGFALQTHEFISLEKAERLRAYALMPGDIVMTRKGTVGNCSVYPHDFPVGMMHSDLLRLRVDKTLCDAEFLSHQLHHSRDVEHQISLISGGAIMAGVNVTKLKVLEVIVPPIDLQQRFLAAIAQRASLRARSSRSAEIIDRLFASLQHRAFRGEL